MELPSMLKCIRQKVLQRYRALYLKGIIKCKTRIKIADTKKVDS